MEAYRFHALNNKCAIPSTRSWAFSPRLGGTLAIGPLRQFGPCAQLDPDGATLRHSGRQNNWGGVCLAEPPLAEGRTYWEVLIRSGALGGHVRLGLATDDFCVAEPQEYLGRNANSLGLYSNGSSISCQGLHSALVNSRVGWNNGDRVGLLLEFHDQHSQAHLSCYRNGEFLGTLSLPHARYYPAFCCHCALDVVCVDFEAVVPGE